MSAPKDAPLIDDRPSLRFTLEVGGATVAVRAYPATAAPLGVLLAVHGFRGDHHGLRRLINALPGYLVVVPDLPGFGGSGAYPGPLGHDVAGHGEVITALREALALGPETVLLGHSYGSIVTSHYLAAHPGSFERLVLVNPICEPALEGSRAITTKLAELYYAASAFLPAKWGERLLRSRLIVDATTAAMVTSSDPVTRAYVRDQHRAYFAGFASPATLLEAYRASVAHTVLEVAGAIQAPTLLVAGSADPLGSVAGQEKLAATFPEARLVMIEGVGHLIHYETPGTAAAAIEEFLAR